MFNSLAIYRFSNGHCTRIAGPYFNEVNFLTQKDNETFLYRTTGDYCKTVDNKDYNYTTTYQFMHKKIEVSAVSYLNLDKPDPYMRDSCERTLEIYTDFDTHREYLLIQKYFDTYYIPTGIVFILMGGFLLFFAKFKNTTKFIISVIFGELFTFTLGVAIIGTDLKYLEWAFFAAGIAIGACIGYFTLGSNRFYRVILAITAGFIFGLIIFDVLFTHLVSRYSIIFLIDTLIIFIALSILVICLQQSFHYFYDSIVGSYIFIRGLCTLMHKAGKYARYRELQLMLYCVKRYEMELAKYFYKEKWPIYYVYTILMFLVMGGSIVFYYFKAFRRDEEDGKKDDETHFVCSRWLLRHRSEGRSGGDRHAAGAGDRPGTRRGRLAAHVLKRRGCDRRDPSAGDLHVRQRRVGAAVGARVSAGYAAQVRPGAQRHHGWARHRHRGAAGRGRQDLPHRRRRGAGEAPLPRIGAARDPQAL